MCPLENFEIRNTKSSRWPARPNTSGDVCCLIKLTVLFSCFFIFLSLSFAKRNASKISWLFSRSTDLFQQVYADMPMQAVFSGKKNNKRSRRRINCCWTFVCMSENCNSARVAFLYSVDGVCHLVKRVHRNKIDFVLSPTTACSSRCELTKVLVKHFLT